MLCTTCGIKLEPGQQSCVTGYPTHQIYDKGEEKMMQNIGTPEEPMYVSQGSGRIRLNITKNTKGRNFDYTVELGAGDNSWLKQGMADVLKEVRAFDVSVVELVHELEMNDARQAQGQ